MPPTKLDMPAAAMKRRAALKLIGGAGVVAVAAPALLTREPLRLTVTKAKTIGFGYTGFGYASASELDAISTAVKKHILPGIVDNVFRTSPVLACLKENSR